MTRDGYDREADRLREEGADPDAFVALHDRVFGGGPEIVDECEGCGDPLEIGVPHDCPVLGTEVRVEWAGHGPDSLAEETGDPVT